MSECKHKQLMTNVNALSFNMYSTLANFERDVHKVDIGTAYTDRKSGLEILHFLLLSNCMQKITSPLNEDELMCYSVLFDGSSNAKTNNKKELFLIKTCEKGKPTFNVMSLEEVKALLPVLKPPLKNQLEKCPLLLIGNPKRLGCVQTVQT